MKTCDFFFDSPFKFSFEEILDNKAASGRKMNYLPDRGKDTIIFEAVTNVMVLRSIILSSWSRIILSYHCKLGSYEDHCENNSKCSNISSVTITLYTQNRNNKFENQISPWKMNILVQIFFLANGSPFDSEHYDHIRSRFRERPAVTWKNHWICLDFQLFSQWSSYYKYESSYWDTYPEWGRGTVSFVCAPLSPATGALDTQKLKPYDNLRLQTI